MNEIDRVNFVNVFLSVSFWLKIIKINTSLLNLFLILCLVESFLPLQTNEKGEFFVPICDYENAEPLIMSNILRESK